MGLLISGLSVIILIDQLVMSMLFQVKDDLFARLGGCHAERTRLYNPYCISLISPISALENVLTSSAGDIAMAAVLKANVNNSI